MTELGDVYDALAVASFDLQHPRDGERTGRRRRFRTAVLALPVGGVEAAWDADLLTVEQYHQALETRRSAGLQP